MVDVISSIINFFEKSNNQVQMDEAVDLRSVADPLDFPTPTISAGVLSRLSVLVDGNSADQMVLHILSIETDRSDEYYEVGRVLKKAIYGQVNFGHVLKRKDGLFHRVGKCAIKIFNKTQIHDLRGTTQENPLFEIAAGQYLGNNVNIAGSINCCHDAQYIYSVMEFVGPELYDSIILQGKLEEEEAKNFFCQILSGIDHMHRKGAAHRDLSLENVLLSSEGVCKIIDFGMALRLPLSDSMTDCMSSTSPTKASAPSSSSVLKIPPQGICGKQHYISPEVYQNREAFDALASDVWALGVMLFIMLAGFPPLEAATPSDPRYGFVRDGKISALLTEWGVHLDDEALDLITRMLDINPKDRLSVEEIWQHPWLQQEPESDEAVELAVPQTKHFLCGQQIRNQEAIQDLLCEQHQTMLLSFCNYCTMSSAFP